MKACCYFLERLREPSTLRGLVLVLTALGIFIEPEKLADLVALGMALSGAIGAALPDRLEDN